MKHPIALGAVLLLSLGSAVAGTFLYGQDDVDGRFVQMHLPDVTAATNPVRVQPDPETIAVWKSTAVASTFVQLKAPI